MFDVQEKTIPVNPVGYRDMGEYAYKMRNFDDYKSMVFKDSSKDWLTTRPVNMVPENSMEWSTRHFHSIRHYVPNGHGFSVSNIKYEWEWKEGSLFGGLDGFFANNSKLLELGSGHGQVIKEINDSYKDRDIEVVGVDYRYHRDRPEEKVEGLVGGNIKNLPFVDNHFNRLLSVESFPLWMPDDKDMVRGYFSEITRVCENGAIWRGTLPVYDNEVWYYDSQMSMEELIKCFCENGWEVVNLRGYSFVAKLHKEIS